MPAGIQTSNMSNPPISRRRQLRTLRPVPGLAELEIYPCEPGAASWPARQGLVDLASNDYLGLSRHPEVLKAATEALLLDGAGAGGSRLVTGNRPVHDMLEKDLSTFLGRERVLLFPSGFQANLAAVLALADRHTIVMADRLVHHSLLQGVRASGARLQRFSHNNLQDLDHRLHAISSSVDVSRLVISESLFSMEGTSPTIDELAAICQDHNARLLLDEAHALGILGPGGRGLAFGFDKESITMISGTFGKAFGSGGAFLACDSVLGEKLLQTSGAFRYTTALAPPLAAAAYASLKLIQSHPDWGKQLLTRSMDWRNSLQQAGWPSPPGQAHILPLILGEDDLALSMQEHLENAGLLTVAIRPPTVPEGTSRLRLTLRRDQPENLLAHLLHALKIRPS